MALHTATPGIWHGDHGASTSEASPAFFRLQGPPNKSEFPPEVIMFLLIMNINHYEASLTINYHLIMVLLTIINHY